MVLTNAKKAGVSFSHAPHMTQTDETFASVAFLEWNAPKNNLLWTAFTCLHQISLGSVQGRRLDSAVVQPIVAKLPQLFEKVLSLADILPTPQAAYEFRLRAIEHVSLLMSTKKPGKSAYM